MRSLNVCVCGNAVEKNLIATVRRMMLPLAFCSLVTGCSEGYPERVPVSGVVLIDGKPLQTGSVRFTPVGSRPAIGTLDANGRFSLSTFKPGDGCVLGTHTVTVHAADSVDEFTVRWNTPKKYATAATSGISKTIDHPTDSLQIELTWGGQPGPFIENQK
jgi:hypothetical protein